MALSFSLSLNTSHGNHLWTKWLSQFGGTQLSASRWGLCQFVSSPSMAPLGSEIDGSQCLTKFHVQTLISKQAQQSLYAP